MSYLESNNRFFRPNSSASEISPLTNSASLNSASGAAESALSETSLVLRTTSDVADLCSIVGSLPPLKFITERPPSADGIAKSAREMRKKSIENRVKSSESCRGSKSSRSSRGSLTTVANDLEVPTLTHIQLAVSETIDQLTIENFVNGKFMGGEPEKNAVRTALNEPHDEKDYKVVCAGDVSRIYSTENSMVKLSPSEQECNLICEVDASSPFVEDMPSKHSADVRHNTGASGNDVDIEQDMNVERALIPELSTEELTNNNTNRITQSSLLETVRSHGPPVIISSLNLSSDGAVVVENG